MARKNRGGTRNTPPRSAQLRQQGNSAKPSSAHQRRLLADEAARILADEGVRDYQMAKRKAASHLGFTDSGQWPGNDEIEHALTERLQLFGGSALQRHTHFLLEVAVDAMMLFTPFQPRLVGPLLRGTATAHSNVELHLFASTREDVTIHLINEGFEFDLCDRQIRTGHKHEGNNQHERVMGVEMIAEKDASTSATIVALIFSLDSIRQAPRSPVDGTAMARATIEQVRTLLQQTERP